MKLLLDAIFINNSGGKVLLEYLIDEIENSGLGIHFLLDNRVRDHFAHLPESRTTFLPNSLKKRHNFYKKYKSELEYVLCFGNVPPTIKLKAKVDTYLHNSVLFYTGSEFEFKTAFSYKLKSWVVRYLKRNTDHWLVQTKFMEQGLQDHWGISPSQIKRIPFFKPIAETLGKKERNKNQLYYISDGHPNKMHHQLIPAFIQASKDHPQMSLYLTISQQYPQLIQQIEQAAAQGIKIKNLGWCDSTRLSEIYQTGGCLIFPSSLESFGLGLLEAAQYGMPVLASDLPFVHEVIKPSATFNPYSVESISKAIRLSQEKELPEPKLIISNSVVNLLERFHLWN
ncbi:glycosyltransferase [Algoriphagus sp.]|uniref:glycosyltransferase n=1 Tax=Algoriphagus sp. TaxID=1872435 RepID=UPI0026072562|nr:glycosyltransferase [Algoriphagus sp.]